MRQYIRSILSSDYNVLEAPNGVVCLEVTNRYQPDLIISDIMMPGFNGYQVLKGLNSKKITHSTPFIFIFFLRFE